MDIAAWDCGYVLRSIYSHPIEEHHIGGLFARRKCQAAQISRQPINAFLASSLG